MADQSLARSLVDAAAEAMRQGGFVDPDDDTVPTFLPSYDPEKFSSAYGVWKPVECAAEVAVAAVLKTLAGHTAPTEPGGPVSVRFLNHDEFVRLAAEVKEEGP